MLGIARLVAPVAPWDGRPDRSWRLVGVVVGDALCG